MATKPDDLDAIRTIVQTLEPFDQSERSRIIRWASEKLGMAVEANPKPTGPNQQLADPKPDPPSTPSSQARDIKTFLSEKSPKSDNQLAAAVAYYYQFEAPENNKKNSINKDDLIDACRKGGLDRLHSPSQTLVNALHAGVLDKGPERGSYTINSVGENLVAMTMPSTTGKVRTAKRKKKGNGKPKKSGSKK